MSPARVEAVKSFPQPQTQKELKSFVCLASHYRRFIRDFARRVAVLQKRTHDKWDGEWTPDMLAAFVDIKSALATAPILQYPDFKAPFLLRTDASKLGAGAVLYQNDAKGISRPVMYASTAFSNRQAEYAAHERECLAIIWALDVFHSYLQHAPFTIETDSAAIAWLLQPDRQKPTKSKYARWRMKLTAYDYAIKHRKGISMTDADPLSRNPLTVEQARKAYGQIEVADIYNTREIFEARSAIQKVTHASSSVQKNASQIPQKSWGPQEASRGQQEMAEAQRQDPEILLLIQYLTGEGTLNVRQRRQARDI